MSTRPAPAITTTVHGDVGVLTYEPLDPAAIEASVRSTKAGAVVSFVGYTRDEFQGKRVTHLDYECYIPLALKTLHQVLLEARQLPSPAPTSSACFGHSHAPHSSSSSTIDLISITAHHLLGPSPPLTPSIVISVASPHRKEAFVACEWVLEEVKKRVQVWKREWYADGTKFEGRDGEGVEGFGGRAREEKEGSSKWKENFPPSAREIQEE
ncbi:Molybdopterin biosynthesis MoaE [Leucosporidium creatinivorum]|uniref:Molybdopterin biosynthesis MoaE n=1 Tax=Leucosporidium creatinivorum TaxID=106004 RepID=A0A1Y2DL54_9BASI|nr:Molybdopterin biosynthesis MoaE [Leucosporidium creatinivorum]